MICKEFDNTVSNADVHKFFKPLLLRFHPDTSKVEPQYGKFYNQILEEVRILRTKALDTFQQVSTARIEIDELDKEIKKLSIVD